MSKLDAPIYIGVFPFQSHSMSSTTHKQAPHTTHKATGKEKPQLKGVTDVPSDSEGEEEPEVGQS